MTKLIKKGFTVSVVVATIFWAIGLAAFLPVGAAAAVAEGDLIKQAGNPTVYYYYASKRYIFPTEATYFSWYSDFSGVKTISQSELEAIPLGTNVVIRPGTKLAKITTNPKVYAVAPNGVLRHIDSEARATTLFGANWAKRVVDVPDGFWNNYTEGAAFTSDVHPAGSLVKYAASGDIYYINADGKKQKFASMDAFNANRFKLSDVITISDTLVYTTGTEITGALGSLTNTAQAGGTATVGTGALTVSLASGNPGAMTVPTKASGVELLRINLTAGSTASALTELTVHRTGVGSVSDFANLYLYDGATRLTSGRSIGSSTNDAVFTNLNVAVAANTTKTLMVKGDIATSPTASDVHYFEVSNAAAVVGAASVAGTFPVKGNAITIGNQAVSTATITKGTTPASPIIGQTGATLSEFKIAAGSHDLELTQIALTQAGSTSNSNLANLKLYANDVLVASSASMTGDKMIFVLDSAYTIPQGITRIFQVKGDISGRSGYTVRTYVEYAIDVVISDKTYGIGAYVDISTSGTFDGSSTGTKYIEVTSKGGKVTVAFNGPLKADVAKGTQDVEFYKFSMTAADQAVEVKTIGFTIAKLSTGNGKVKGSTNNTFTDLKITDLTAGKTIMGPKEYVVSADATTTGEVSFTDSFVINAGETKNLVFTADVRNTEDTSGDFIDDAFQATLSAFGDTSIREVSTNQYLTASTDIVPYAVNTGNNMTVKSSALTVALASTPSSANLVKRATGVNTVAFSFDAGSQSAVKVNSITMTGYGDLDGGASYTVGEFDDVVLSASLWDGTTQVGSTVSPTSAGVLAFTNLNWTVPAGTSKKLTVKTDVSSTAGTGDNDMYYVQMAGSAISATDKDSNTVDVTGTYNDSPTVAHTVYSAGSLTVGQDSASPDADIVVAGNAGVVMSKFKFAATREGYNVTKARIIVYNVGASAYNANTDDNFDSIVIEYPKKDGTTGTATGYLSSGAVQFSGLEMYVPKDGVAVLTVKGNLNTINAGADSGEQPRLDIDNDNATDNGYFAASGEDSGTAVYDSGSADITGKGGMVVRATKPTVTKETLGTTLTTGDNQVFKFKVAADAAHSVALKTLCFNISTYDDSASALTLGVFKLYNAANMSTPLNVTIVDATATDLESGTLAEGNNQKVWVQFDDGSAETIAAGSSKTYVLKGTVANAALYDNITTTLYTTGEVLTTGALAAGATHGRAQVTNSTENDYFVWSDYSGGDSAWSDTVASSSSDWTNGYLVKTLPSDSHTLTW
ncbi:MAG: hypothetical protein WC310_00665 [Patescibacteria group bacterium]